MLYSDCSLFGLQVIDWEDRVYMPVKWLAGKSVSSLTSKVSDGMLNSKLIHHFGSIVQMKFAVFVLDV